jgi:hypothetical protein
MVLGRTALEKFVMQVQGDFLHRPLLTLTVAQAQERYRERADVCRAVLDMLADSRVLARTPEGVYRRWFPGRYTRYTSSGYAA